MYINLQFRRRAEGTRYRLERTKTQRLRRREDYPRRADGGVASADGHLPKAGRRRLFLGCLIVAVVLFAGAFGIWGAKRPVGCRIEDFGAPVLPTVAEAADEDAPKTVYLTFDDGPSENTEKVLNVLKEAGVPATFFVVGAENNTEHLPLLQRTLAEGHCIGLHSCTHEYRKIYASADAYWTDIEALKLTLQPYCGDYAFSVLRFPGGTSNTVSHKYGGSGLMEELAAQAKEKGFTVVDWNVSAEDSIGGHPSANTIASRVIRDCKGKASAIILMHDSSTNDATVEALPTIIGWLQENGYTFDTADHLPGAEQAETPDGQTADGQTAESTGS